MKRWKFFQMKGRPGRIEKTYLRWYARRIHKHPEESGFQRFLNKTLEEACKGMGIPKEMIKDVEWKRHDPGAVFCARLFVCTSDLPEKTQTQMVESIAGTL